MAKILVIDDEQAIGLSFQKALQRKGHDVDVEVDAECGLQSALQGQYDLVITDLIMPGLSGTEIIKHLRDIKPDIPVIAMSGMRQLDYVGAFGVDVIMEKPFRMDELFVVVDQQVENRIELVEA